MMGNAHWAVELCSAILATVIAITLHEAAHGYAALALGDDTAKRMGRLSLNPLRHVDRFGTIILPGILLLGQLLTLGRVEFMFGWAKPVPVDVSDMPHPRRAMALVATAGPAMNFGLALLAGFAAHLVAAIDPLLGAAASNAVFRFLGLFILANLVLGLFNLLPIPPLDGGRVVAGLLPDALARPYMELERWGIFIVLFMVFLLPRLSPGHDPVGWALNHVIERAFGLVLILSGNGDVL